MINTLPDYCPQSVPQVLTTAPGLREKVSPEGKLLPFPGNTVVFLLTQEEKEKIAAIRDRLTVMCPHMFGEDLESDTFHVTLHDLANGTLLSQREEMATLAKTRLDTIRSQSLAPIPMQATWSFNMVNTSVVLGLEPIGEEAWQSLDSLYEQFQQVRFLDYALTPHITLAYYRPGIYGEAETEKLRAVLKPIDLQITLHPERLVLQDFDHMNAYHTVY